MLSTTLIQSHTDAIFIALQNLRNKMQEAQTAGIGVTISCVREDLKSVLINGYAGDFLPTFEVETYATIVMTRGTE